jgi:uncharacterized protein YutE (UPF0331/DUF86 family)
MLYEAKMVKKILNDIKRLIFLRNLIAHEYNITKEELKGMASLLKYLEELVGIVKKLS